MQRATALSRDADRLLVTVDDERSLSARAVILATGSSYRRLGVPALEDLIGAGVFYGGRCRRGTRCRARRSTSSAAATRRRRQPYTWPATPTGSRSSCVPGAPRGDVALPGPRGRGDAELGGSDGHDGRRRRRRRAPRAPCAAKGTDEDQETVAADGLFVLIGPPAHRLAAGRDSQGPPRIPVDRRGPHRRSSVPTRTAASSRSRRVCPAFSRPVMCGMGRSNASPLRSAKARSRSSSSTTSSSPTS